MSSLRRAALATAAFAVSSCTLFDKGGEDYDTVDGAYDTSNPYGVPGESYGDSAPYQAVNPPADNPTYSEAAYEDTAAVPAAQAVESASHTVVRGDTLSGIARRYGVSIAAIKQANGMTNDTVVLGRTMVIPGASGPVAQAPPVAGGKFHTVSRGDTLSSISRKHGVGIDAIKRANGMTNDTVVLGSKLRIP